jgi:hypothetical protein
MTSTGLYNTYQPGKQAQIIQDLMDLFRSNSRGYGVGEFQGARFDEDKNKWVPGHIQWKWGETSEQEWRDHLTGVRLLGQGVLCDDNKVWYSCLDIDSYDIDYNEEMNKIKRSGLPLVVFRTKSGGLRVTLFFREPIEADLCIPRMRRVASLLGYAGCEIFPKQLKLDASNGDCPSWIFMPYGGSGANIAGNGSPAMFPEQGCMNDNGGLMDLAEGIAYAMQKRLSQSEFVELFTAEESAKANGKANGRKHPRGSWVEEDSYETTINTMFCDGPPCLWTISHQGSHDMQNNFLVNVSTFLKRKYPENWEKALEWVNYNVLKPVGDREKLNSIVKRGHGQDYEYMCQQEPICSHCNPHACRRMPFGVGTGANGMVIDYHELALTIIDREPRIYFVSLGDNGKRIQCIFDELWHQNKFQVKCGDYGVPAPPTMKRIDWENIVRRNIEDATIVQPTQALRTSALEYEILTAFFSIHVPTFMRIGEKGNDDAVRVRVDEQRVYFKWKNLSRFIMRSFSGAEIMLMRKFVDDKKNCNYQQQEPGFRDWWRFTYSISFDKLDEEDMEKWLAAGTED